MAQVSVDTKDNFCEEKREDESLTLLECREMQYQLSLRPQLMTFLLRRPTVAVTVKVHLLQPALAPLLPPSRPPVPIQVHQRESVRHRCKFFALYLNM